MVVVGWLSSLLGGVITDCLFWGCGAGWGVGWGVGSLISLYFLINPFSTSIPWSLGSILYPSGNLSP